MYSKVSFIQNLVRSLFFGLSISILLFLGHSFSETVIGQLLFQNCFCKWNHNFQHLFYMATYNFSCVYITGKASGPRDPALQSCDPDSFPFWYRTVLIWVNYVYCQLNRKDVQCVILACIATIKMEMKLFKFFD